MKRGCYKIQDGFSGSGGGKEASEYVWPEAAARPPDSSYSSCVLALILFLFLCVVIMLAAWPWKAGKSTEPEDIENPRKEGLLGGRVTTASISLSTVPEENPLLNNTPPPIAFSTPNTNSSTVFSSVEFLPGKGENESDAVGRTMKPRTHADLVDGKEERVTFSEEGMTREEEDHCWTPACRSFASQMLAMMNHSMEACQDMYEFACGGMRSEGGEWIAEDLKSLKPLQRVKDMLHKPSKSRTHKLFKEFIDKCNHYDELVSMEERLNKAKEVITNVGMFLIDKSENGSIHELFVNLLLHNFPTIFDISLEPESPHKLSFKLSLPESVSPLGHASENDILLNGWKSNACLKQATERPRDGRKEDDLNGRYIKYIQCTRKTTKYITEVREALKALKLFFKDDELKAKTFIEGIVSFLQGVLLVEIQKQLPNQTEKITLMTREPAKQDIYTLQGNFSMVAWKELLEKLVGDSISIDFDLEEVNTYHKSYFKHIFRVLESLDAKELYNGLLAMFAHEVYYGLVVNRNSCFREEYCFAVASNLMPEAVSSLFLSSFHKDQLQEYESQIHYLFTLLKSQMLSEVEAIYWLKDKSRDIVLKKISGMKLIADGGYPLFLDDVYLDNQYKGYPSNSTYLEDAVFLMKRLRQKMYSAKEESPLKEIWSLFVPAYSSKAKALYKMNAVVVPYGVMLQPFTTSNSSRYLQMATVGSQIAKVMWQHFDETGYHSNHAGSTFNSINDETKSSMRAVTECMKKQYQTEIYKVDEGITLKYKLPESLSINSRLADIGGIHLAFQTMMRNMSGADLPWIKLKKQQVFYLTIAQSMCTRENVYQYTVSMFEDEDLPPFLRVEDMARNSEEFKEAFFCEVKVVTDACLPFTLAAETTESPRDIFGEVDSDGGV